MSVSPKVYAASSRYHAAGLSTVPIATDGTKRPTIPWKPLQETPLTDEERRRHYQGGAWIGVVCGAVSGNLTVIDFDEPGLVDAFRRVCGEHEIHCELPQAQTPSGGAHLYLRCETAPRGNEKLARNAAGVCRIETRGEGGYVLAPPTPGYCFVPGSPPPDMIQVLTETERGALLSLARLFDDYAPPLPTEAPLEATETRPERSGGKMPGEAYNESGEALSILQAHGWQVKGKHGANVGLLRPGKTGQGISATYNTELRVFYPFSSNAAPFEAGKGYSNFQVFALLEHDGDFSAAARALNQLGYGDPLPKSVPVTLKGKATEPNAETEEGAIPADDWLLAQAWVKTASLKYCFVEGDQWREYVANRWDYSSHEDVECHVQAFLATHGKVTPARVRNVKFIGRNLLGVTKIKAFNAQTSWIPLRNGVYDTVAGDLLSHDPAHLITYQLPYDYNPDAECPLWRKFLNETLIKADGTPCEEWQTLLQEWYGYLLIPNNAAQVSMFWLGEGGNGKGVATRCIEEMVGAESVTAIPIDMLHDPYHRAEIENKLVGLVNEPDRKAMQKNGAWFKLLTGGNDLISARRPTEKVFRFKSTCRIIVTCNEMPPTSDPSRAYFRRIIPVEWRWNVPDDRKDPDLDRKLRAEMSGIFNWAIEGLNRLRERGFRFQMPDESASLLESYKLDNDHLKRFFLEECVFGDGNQEEANTLYRAYKNWSEESGLRAESAQAFGRRLTGKGCVRSMARKDGGFCRLWTGVRLVSESDLEGENDADFTV